ncbi:dihydrofolate reductase family protein [Streptomyces phytohabitans]|uniref:dihydrofolate reductase family protein n=1 Tax=Streptomyces phytohabitans TaxID=1150371 RepID=UPI00345C0C93
MGNVIVDISMSLDGYVTGPRPGVRNGLGDGGERLHDWALGRRTEGDQAVLDATTEATGAVVMGRRTFDVVDGPDGWNDDMGYGGERDQSAAPPVFVLTSSQPPTVRLASLFTICTEGTENALRRAREAAGDRSVVIMGGADVARRCLDAGLVDEVRLHLTPVVLGGGTPLFGRTGTEPPVALEQTDVRATPYATHLTYRVLGRDRGRGRSRA